MSRQRRRRRGRSKYGFLLVFFALVAMLLAFSLSSGLFFKITEIRVEGVTVYDPEKVREAAGYKMGDNILLINKTSAIRNIFNSMPYVEQVKIRRELPGTVIIEITEAAPVAMIENHGLYWLINGSGMLLDSVPLLSAPKLPVIVGMPLLAPLAGTAMGVPEKDRPKTAPLLELISELIARGMWEDVSEIDMTALSDVRFRYAGRFTISLGVPDNIPFKLEFMQSAIERIESYKTGLLDVSEVPSGPARFIPDGS